MRFASKRLALEGQRSLGGYHLRFSHAATRKVLGGGARRIRVSVRMAQTVYLDSGGGREDRALTSTTRTLPLATAATAIVPTDGWYVGDSKNRFLVEQGSVVHCDLPGGGSSSCA
jgi:hypothetical protein